MTLEYLAGIVDGEGYIRSTVSNHKYFYVRLQVVNTHRGLLDEIQRCFGGSIRDHAGTKPRLGKKPIWKWDTAGRNADRILNLILPHLIVKREQALRALDEMHRGKAAA